MKFHIHRLYKESSKSYKRDGLTLIELLVVIGILIILAALAFPAYRVFEQASDLNGVEDELVGTLRLAQSKTLASEDASQYGVYFESGKYVLFKGAIYDSISLDNIVHDLPKDIEIYNIVLVGGGEEVVFNRVAGDTGQVGIVEMRVTTDPLEKKTICITQFIIGFCGTVPVVGRIQDARHVHFDLGWSIQPATSLKFVFPGPDPDQVETIDMDSFFNIDKTEFDWNNGSSPFVVLSQDQIFRIHTHLLDGGNTILSIHRDRNDGVNAQEVIIYIIDGGVDKEIAHYLADVADTVEQGTYVINSMEKQ